MAMSSATLDRNKGQQGQQPQKTNMPHAPVAQEVKAVEQPKPEPRADAPKFPNVTFPHQQEAEDYLTYYGWVKQGNNRNGESVWQTPPAGPVEKRVLLLPRRNDPNNPERVEQTVGPAIPWEYTMTQALELQKAHLEPTPPAIGSSPQIESSPTIFNRDPAKSR